jgi:hypothetical protein
MLAITVCHLLMRTLATALLLITNSLWLLLFMVGDMSVFMLLKTARGDFRVWMNVPGWMGLVVSFLMRLFTKLLTDFTASIGCRHW